MVDCVLGSQSFGAARAVKSNPASPLQFCRQNSSWLQAEPWKRNVGNLPCPNTGIDHATAQGCQTFGNFQAMPEGKPDETPICTHVSNCDTFSHTSGKAPHGCVDFKAPWPGPGSDPGSPNAGGGGSYPLSLTGLSNTRITLRMFRTLLDQMGSLDCAL
jgi:hypothetical protein